MLRLGVPRLGIYSSLVKDLFEKLGFEVIMPSKISPDIIHAGVMNSAEMICFPYKVTLGTHIYNLEHGATDLLMVDTRGDCRFKHYHRLQELTLQQLGYDFTMHTFTAKNAIPKLIKLAGLAKTPVVFHWLFKALPALLAVERKAYPKNGELKIGIIGEIYTILEPDINFDMIKRLQRMGVTVDVSIKLSDFIRHMFWEHGRQIERKEAKKLLSQQTGGHGFQSIYNTIFYGRQLFDGIIHLLPLSCAPESTVEVLVDQMAQKYNIPIYRFAIDEASFELGFSTRLETFVSMLNRRKANALLR